MIELFIGALVTQATTIYLFKKLSNKKIEITIINIVIIILSTIIQVFLNTYNHTIGTLFSIMYFYLIFIKLFKCKKIESQNYSIIIWTISLLLDMSLMVIGKLLNLTIIYLKYTKIYKSIASIIMSLVLMLLANVKPFIKLLNKLYNKMSKLKITMNHIAALVIIFIFLGFMSSENMDDKFVVTTLLITGISVLAIVITFISMKYQIFMFKKTNEILEKNDIINRRIITQYRILKHNLESQLLGVKTVSNKKAKELIDDLIKEYNSSFYIKHDINEMPPGINGYVFEKLYKYHKNNLEISVTNKIKSNVLDVLGPRSYNLFYEALGVTLDNALEASNISKEKLIYLEFKENKEKITLKIMNTFSGNIDIDKLGTIQYTSKEKGHGLGLFSLIGRKNLTITTSIKNNLFINNIEVKKKIKSGK